MASRRRVGDAFSSMGDAMFRFALQRMQADYEHKLQSERQGSLSRQNAEQRMLDELSKNPQALSRFTSMNPGKLLNGVDPSVFLPSQQEALGASQSELAKVNTLQEVPTDLDLEGSHFARPGAVRDPRDIEALIAQRNARKSHLATTNPIRVDSAYNQMSGEEEVQLLDPLTREVQSRVTTGPGPQQQGLDKASAERAYMGAPNLLADKIKFETSIEDGLRPSKTRTAFSQANAGERGRMTPELIDARVDEANRKAQGQAAAVQSGQSTEGERRAATLLTPLIVATERMKGLEAQGAYIQTGAQTAATYPMIGSAANFMGMVDEKNQQYVNLAMETAGILTQLRSGVQAREDEYQRFLAIMSVMPGDTPQTVQQKQRSRDVLLQAAQISMGRSAREGGNVLGRAVRDGVLSDQILETLKMDRDFSQGVLEVLNGVIK